MRNRDSSNQGNRISPRMSSREGFNSEMASKGDLEDLTCKARFKASGMYDHRSQNTQHVFDGMSSFEEISAAACRCLRSNNAADI